MLCHKRWEHDVAGCRREEGACGSEVRGLGIARVMVPGHLRHCMPIDEYEYGN